jgi:hypothetical protein
MDFVPVGQCDEGQQPTDKQRELFEHADGTVPCVFFVEDISKGEGCALHPPGRPGAIVRRKHGRWTTAHEVAHVLGLRHGGDSTHLMHDVPSEISPASSAPVLKDEEVTIIKGFFANLPAGLSPAAIAPGPPVPASRWNPFLDVRSDTIDLRDRMYEPGLRALPARLSPEAYRRAGVPVLDQGDDGACTGYALATVVHCLLRTRDGVPDTAPVSPRMLYETARAYDDWPDDQLLGASPRATLKGWARHGVCADELWQAQVNDSGLRGRAFTDATTRPLGAYFRVRCDDLTAMQSALREVGALFASCSIHRGWRRVSRRTGVIPHDARELGRHAVAIVGYDERGFWLQNSWGERWGLGGLALLSYDDWLANGIDVWAVQLGVPIARGAPRLQSGAKPTGTVLETENGTVIAIDDRGRLRRRGPFASDEPRMASRLRDPHAVSKRRRPPVILLYVPCGEGAEERIGQECEWLARHASAVGVTPLSILWTSGIAVRLETILREELARRAALDVERAYHWRRRWDDSAEALLRRDGAHFWAAVKARAVATLRDSAGGVRAIATQIANLVAERPDTRIHLACHGTGALQAIQLAQYLTASGLIPDGPLATQRGLAVRVSSFSLWRPACSIHVFKRVVWPLVRSEAIARVQLFTATRAEARRQLVPGLYSRSLLHLTSAALERTPERTVTLFGGLAETGVAVLGLADHVRRDRDLRKWFNGRGRRFRDVEIAPGAPDPAAEAMDVMRATFGQVIKRIANQRSAPKRGRAL